MSFLTYREKIFGIKSKPRVLRRKSSGRLKTIDSTTDCRAWALEDEVRSEYIKEVISQPVSHVGRFIPPEVILKVLKESRLKKLKQRRLQKRSYSEENISLRKKRCTDVLKLREIIKDLDDKLEDLKEENDILKASGGKKDSELKALKRCVKEMKLRSDEPEHTSSEWGPEFKKAYEESHSAITHLSSKLEEKTRLYDELSQENAKLKFEVVEGLKAEMLQYKSRIDELLTSLEKSEGLSEELSESNSKAEQKCNTLAKLIAQREGDVLSAQKEISSIKKEFLLQEAEHKEYVEYLKLMYDKKVKEVHNHIEKCKELEELCEELENNRSQLVLKNKLISDNLSYYRTHFYTLVDCNKRLSRSIDLLKRDLNEAKEEITKKPAQLKLGFSIVQFKLLEKIISNNNVEHSEDIHDLRGSLLSARKIVDSMKLQSLGEVEGVQAKFSFAQVEIQTDSVDIKDAATQLELNSSDRGVQTNLIDSFEPKYNESNRTVYMLSSTLLEMEKNIISNHQEIDELQRKIHDLTIEYNNRMNELIAIKDKNENLAEQIVCLESQQRGLEELKEKIAEFEASMEVKDLDIQHLNNEKLELQDKLDAFTDQMDLLKEMKNQLELQIEENSLNREEIAKLSESNEMLQKQSERLQNDWENSQNKVNTMNEVLYKEQELSKSLENEVFNLMNMSSMLEEKLCSHKLIFKRINNVLGEFDLLVSSINVNYSGNLRELETFHLDCIDHKEVLMKAVFLIKHQEKQISGLDESLKSVSLKLKNSSTNNKRLMVVLSRKNRKQRDLKTSLNHVKRKLYSAQHELKMQIVNSQDRQSLIKGHNDEVHKLKDDNKELKKGLDNMKFIICDLEECVQQKNNLLRETETHRDNIQNELSRAKMELQELVTKCNKETLSVSTNTENDYEPEVQLEVEQLKNKVQNLSSVLVILEEQLKIQTEKDVQKRDCCTQVNFRPNGVEVRTIKGNYEKRIATLLSNYEKERESTSKQNLTNLRLVKDNYEREIKRIKQIHNENIEKLQCIHSEEIAVLKTMKDENIHNQQKLKDHHLKEMSKLKSHYEILLKEQEKRLQTENECLQKKLTNFMASKEAELCEINEKVVHEINMAKNNYKKKLKAMKDYHRVTWQKRKAEFVVRLEKERIQDKVKMQKEKSRNLSVVKLGPIEIQPEESHDEVSECVIEEPTKLPKKTNPIVEEIKSKLESELDYKWKIQCRLRDEYNRAEQYMKRNLELSSKLTQLEKKLKDIEGEVQNEKLKATHMRLQSKLDMATGYLNRSCDASTPKENEYSVIKTCNEEKMFLNTFDDNTYLINEKSVSSTNLTVKFIQQCGILHSWNKNV